MVISKEGVNFATGLDIQEGIILLLDSHTIPCKDAELCSSITLFWALVLWFSKASGILSTLTILL